MSGATVVRRALFSACVVVGLLVPTRAAAQGGTVEYYGTDAIGSVRIVFDATGTVVGRMDYGPFGEQLSASTVGHKSYAGLFRDGDAGLDYAQARMYQSRTGRFEKPDPIYDGLLTPQKWNRYNYASNNPIIMVDPEGLAEYVGTPQSTLAAPLTASFTHSDVTVTAGFEHVNLMSIWLAQAWNGSSMTSSLGWRGRGQVGSPPTTNPAPTNPAPPNPAPPNPAPPNPTPHVPGPQPGAEPNRWAKRWDCYKGNYAFAVDSTNDFFFGSWTKRLKTGVGSLTSGAVARSFGTTTLGMAASDLMKGQGVANLGVRGTLISVGANAVVNGAAVAGALEVGILIGSGLDAALETSVGNCM